MAQKSGLSRILEIIGIIDNNESETGSPTRSRAEQYDNRQRFTPRSLRNSSDGRVAVQAGSDARRSRNGEKARLRPSFSGGAEEERAVTRPNQKLRTSPSTMVYYLHSLSECSSVIQDLIRGNSVLLNLEETDNALTQRIVDTLAGASFALRAKIRKVSEKMYLIAPENMEVNMTHSVERRY